MALRTKVLKYLEKKPSDFLTLTKELDIHGDEVANELNNLLKAGYITKRNSNFYLTDRGREYLKVEES
ncbi:TPA: hypothetical protein EYP75_00540 [Candidatus Bathyarchaeota archaeon]|nr:hypothetical protein [Candidatus Bathyarchaeota archaeon]